MIRASGAIGASPRRVSPPKAFDWDFATYPVTILDGGNRRYKTDFDPRSKVAPGIWNGPQYWVAFNGSDENAGTSRKAPLASAWKARQIAEADPSAANGYSINFVPDPATGLIFLHEAQGFSSRSSPGAKEGADTSNRPFGLVCHGGRLIMGPSRNQTYSRVDDATNTWVSSAEAGVAAVYNIAELGPFGVQSRMAKVSAGVTDDATAQAAVAGAPGDAWAQAPGSTKLYVRLASGQTVSDASVLVAQTAHGLQLGTGDVYVSGVELIGGTAAGGAISVGSAAPRTVVLEDVGAWGSGAVDGPAQPSFGIAGMTGFAILHRCYAYNSLESLFSFGDPDAKLHAMMIDCWGVDAGYPGADPISYANHIVSVRDAARLISLNTRGSYSAGGCVGGSGRSQHWDLGSIYAYDRGNFWSGPDGTVPPTGVQISDRAKYFGHDITVAGCATSFHAYSKSACINLRSPVEIGGRREGPGSIGDY